MIEFLKNLKAKKAKQPIRIVFICTANCCRSPLAEILFEKMLIAKVGSAEILAKKNILIESAATSYSGLPIAERSAKVLLTEEGISLKRCNIHKGRHISEIEEPDLLLTMSMSHRIDIELEFPKWADKTFTLEQFVMYDQKSAFSDIRDPINGTDEEFKKVKDHIKKNLILLLEEFKQAGLLE